LTTPSNPNPNGDLIMKLGDRKLSTKKSLEELLEENIQEVNYAIYLWFLKFLDSNLGKSKKSKNENISGTF